MNETWYVLEDGTSGDPRDIAPGKDGKLVHKDGRKVDYAAHGPRSRSVDAEAERSKSEAPKPARDPDGQPASAAAPGAAPSGKAMKPSAAKGGYATRESKAD